MLPRKFVDALLTECFAARAEIVNAVAVSSESEEVDLDFGVLPPEVNSGRMYAGPGAGPMLAAAVGWDGLSVVLGSVVVSYSLVVAELASSLWLGPASLLMVAAVMPFIKWLSSAAELAEQAGGQLRATAAAYEDAFTGMVPPPVVVANRVLLTTLIATNFLGQNTPKIAVTEAQYDEMWAQDAAVMYGYAGSAAVASELTLFTPPVQSVDVVGSATQAEVATEVVSAPASQSTQAVSTVAPELAAGSAVPRLLQQLSSGVLSLGFNPDDWSIMQRLGSITPELRIAAFRTVPGLVYFGLGTAQYSVSIAQQLMFGPGGTTVGSGGAWYPTPQFAGLTPSVGLASAGKVGSLSVPHTWLASTASMEQSTEHMVGRDVVASGSPSGANGLLHGLPVGGMKRRATGGFTHKYGFKQSVLTRPPSAG